MSQTTANDIAQIELSMEEAQKMVDRGDEVRALIENPLFKKIIGDGYFVQEAARLVHLSSDTTITEEIRGYVMRDMAGPGAFKRYLQTLINMGNIARNELAQGQEVLDELRQEEGDE